MRRAKLLLLAGLVAGCRDEGQEHISIAEEADQTEIASKLDVVIPWQGEPPLPADCAIEKDFRDWLFMPTLEPIPPGPTNPRNSARRVHRLRDRIVRVEIVHEYTRRPLFELSDSGVAALRERPDWPPLRLRNHSLPPGKDWPVVFLIYLEGEELPYAGHPYARSLYFAEDEKPWVFYVFEGPGEPRDIHPIPFGRGVYAALEEKLGRPDPGGMRAREAKREHKRRCDRSPPTPPERPRTFPVPRAIIEPAEQTDATPGTKVPIPDLPKASIEPAEEEPQSQPAVALSTSADHCFELGLRAEDLDALNLGKGAAVRLRGGPYDFRHLVADAQPNGEYRMFSFCGVIAGERYDVTLERRKGARPEVLSEGASLDSLIRAAEDPEHHPIPIPIHVPRPPEKRELDEDD